MGLTTVTNGNTAQANDLNQVINILQQPSGGQEKGQYYLNGWGNASGDYISYWLSSLTRVAVPISVSIDTSIDISPNLNSPNTGHLSANGFQVNATLKAASVNEHCGGNYTIQF